MYNSKLFSGLMECALSEMEATAYGDNRFVRAYHVRQAYALLKAAERLKYGSNDRDSCFHIVFKDKVDNNPSRLMTYALSEMERINYSRHCEGEDRNVRLYDVRKVYALLKTVERLKDSGNDRDNYFHFIFNEDDDGFPEPFTENSLCFPRDGAEVRYPKCYYHDDEDEDEDKE